MTPVAAALLAGLVLVPLGVHLVTLIVAALRLRRPVPAAPSPLPFVCLLRPVCGLDRFDEETLASGFLQDYPDYEQVFCCADARDPVVPLIRRLIARYPQARARFFTGDLPVSANPKLNNVARGWGETAADYICMTDSNVLLPPAYLRETVASFRDDTGLVTAPALGIRAEGFQGALECAFLNSFQGRFQLVADAFGNGFAQGKTLFWRRSVCEAGGGLAALGREMAEDVASTKLVRGQGLRVRLAPRLYPQPVGRRSLAQVWSRQLRWSRVRRAGFPWLFLPEILTGFVPPFLALAALVAGGAAPAWMLPALAVLWFGAEWSLARGAGWPARGIDLAAMVARDALLPALWLWSWRARGFVWRGNAMDGEALTPAPDSPGPRAGR